MANTQDAKAQSEARFSERADRYVNSTLHVMGPDIERLITMSGARDGGSSWRAIDIATGGGHNALAFAPLVGRITAYDISQKMLHAARGFLTTNGIANADYCGGDAENLPFADGTFDLVTCRIAPHHFPDAFRFVQECARVLKPGGVFALQDQAIPEEQAAGEFIEAFETLRDPSHHRAFAEYEWRGMMLDADLGVEASELSRRPAKLLQWARMQDCDDATIERLQVMLMQAPPAAVEWWRPSCAGTDDAGFDHVHLLITARKP